MRRRDVLIGTAAAAATALHASAAAAPKAAAARPHGAPFGYCLNTGTIRGQKLGIVKEIDTAAKAGFGAIEPWVGEIKKYKQSGGSLGDLKKRLADAGLKVPGGITFFAWLSDDGARRAKALEQAKEEMDLLRQIGGTGIAAPPAGMRGAVDLLAAAGRYGELLTLGRKMGVVPQLEIWGSSKALGRVGQAAFVAAESGHAEACVLLDAFHVYKGGSPFTSLNLVSGRAMHTFHLNDYPKDPPREAVNDSHRVMPGDGVAPMSRILTTLRETGFRGWLSLELFNRDYWRKPADEVARVGLAKMKAAVAKALS